MTEEAVTQEGLDVQKQASPRPLTEQLPSVVAKCDCDEWECCHSHGEDWHREHDPFYYDIGNPAEVHGMSPCDVCGLVYDYQWETRY